MPVRRAGVAALVIGAVVGALPAGVAWAGGAEPRTGTTSATTAATSTAAALSSTDEVGQLYGTVRDDAGTPIAGASVAVLGCAPACPQVATTNASGRYVIFGVPAAPRLGVVAWRGSDLLRQWFPLADSPAQAGRFALAPGEARGPLDFALTRGAYVEVEVRGTRRDEPLRAVVHLIGPRDTHHQYIAHEPVALLADDPAAGGPAAPVRLRMGPVPPGAYAVRVSRGLPDPGKLPDRWVTRTPAAPRPTVQLTAGQESVTSAPLVGTEGGDTSGAGAPATDPGGWPGLASGFLSAGGWRALLDGAETSDEGTRLRLIPPRGTLGS